MHIPELRSISNGLRECYYITVIWYEYEYNMKKGIGIEVLLGLNHYIFISIWYFDYIDCSLWVAIRCRYTTNMSTKKTHLGWGGCVFPSLVGSLLWLFYVYWIHQKDVYAYIVMQVKLHWGGGIWTPPSHWEINGGLHPRTDIKQFGRFNLHAWCTVAKGI